MLDDIQDDEPSLSVTERKLREVSLVGGFLLDGKLLSNFANGSRGDTVWLQRLLIKPPEVAHWTPRLGGLEKVRSHTFSVWLTLFSLPSHWLLFRDVQGSLIVA